MNFLQKHSLIALAYFLFIALLGLFLRLFPLVDVSLNYRHVVHSHSHVAFLGWVYTAVTTIIYKLYLDNASIEKKYRILFWCTQVTIIGMLVTFPFTGYALFSIIFSTLFLFTSYIFTWLFIKYTPNNLKKTNAYKCIRISLWYMILSSLGPWALGIIINTLGSGSDLYRNAIYFYLHFQYNGWFLLALFGIFFFILEKHDITISKKAFHQFFWLFNSGVVATFGISLLWMKPHFILYIISGLGALLQLIAFGILAKEILPFKKVLLNENSTIFNFVLKTTVSLFLVKLILQLLGAIPHFANSISSNIDFVIGYLHWIFLGVVSIALLGFLECFRLIRLFKKGIIIYLIGFALTEGLIFYKGMVVWLKLPLIDDYQMYLIVASGILLTAITIIFSFQFKKDKR